MTTTIEHDEGMPELDDREASPDAVKRCVEQVRASMTDAMRKTNTGEWPLLLAAVRSEIMRFDIGT